MMTLLVFFHWMWSLTVLPERTIFRTGSSCMNFLFVRNHNLSHSQVCEKTLGWIVKLFAGVASCLQWGFPTLKNNFWGKLSIWCGWWWELFMCCGANVIPWWGENSQLMIQQLGFGQSELQYSFQIWVVTFRAYGPTVGENVGVSCLLTFFFFFLISGKGVGGICTSTISNPMWLWLGHQSFWPRDIFVYPSTLLKPQRWRGKCLFINVRH